MKLKTKMGPGRRKGSKNKSSVQYVPEKDIEISSIGKDSDGWTRIKDDGIYIKIRNHFKLNDHHTEDGRFVWVYKNLIIWGYSRYIEFEGESVFVIIDKTTEKIIETLNGKKSYGVIGKGKGFFNEKSVRNYVLEKF